MNREWVIIAILGVPSEVLELISFRSTKWKPFTFISWYTDVMPGVSKILTFSLMVLAMTFFWFILLFLYFVSVSKFQDLDWSALRSNLQWNFDTVIWQVFSFYLDQILQNRQVILAPNLTVKNNSLNYNISSNIFRL